MSLIGLDIGTTGCKAIVFDEQGRILGQAAREYPILTPLLNPDLASNHIFFFTPNPALILKPIFTYSLK